MNNQKSLKILFYCLEGAGHSNACIGLSQTLAKRDHRIYFLITDAVEGQFTKYGFNEIVLKKIAKQNGTDHQAKFTEQAKKNPIKELAEGKLRSGRLSGKSSFEKLKVSNSEPNCLPERLCQFYNENESQIARIIEILKPDAIILSQFLVPPAIARSNVVWINLHPMSPISLYSSPKVPPFYSGFPCSSDPATWQEFRHFQLTEYIDRYRFYQKALNEACGYYVKTEIHDPERSFWLKSDYLNVYGYPAELDYNDIAPLPANSARVDAFCSTDVDQIVENFKLPVEFSEKFGESLIYFSLGSMCSIDVGLMRKILSVLAQTPHRYIVSKGPMADEYDLPPNCWGEAFLPQKQILPLVQLVITHGGNNTVTETFCYGKPMIVMPLFSDQYDNAQRVHEKGYGIRLEPYSFQDWELIEAIERLLNDQEMKQRMLKTANRIKASNSKVVVCEKIEKLCSKFSW